MKYLIAIAIGGWLGLQLNNYWIATRHQTVVGEVLQHVTGEAGR